MSSNDTKTLQDWTKVIDGHINVPDELDPIINKVGMQLRLHTISGKGEAQTVCHIVYAAQKFFHEMYASYREQLAMEENVDRNMNLISDFLEHIKSEHGISIPEEAVLSFFNA